MLKIKFIIKNIIHTKNSRIIYYKKRNVNKYIIILCLIILKFIYIVFIIIFIYVRYIVRAADIVSIKAKIILKKI
ncbi:hypothetical protein KQ44_09860 [Brachyspira sp. G79]|nr:hypothetical protein KQ44_09860 [Brachyspira sp. G79]